jgi:PAS domain S-box-containing protein
MGGFSDEERKRLLKEAIRQLHAGAPPSEVKERFKLALEGVGPLDIARIEQELIGEGISREEIQRLCDVHLEIFKEQLEGKAEAAPGSPVGILREEHEALRRISERLSELVGDIQRAEDLGSAKDAIEHLRGVAVDLSDAEKHYLREENVLFPILERHGITEPPAIMWMEHNQLRERKKQLKGLVENPGGMGFAEFKERLGELAASLRDLLSSHIFKEDNILFPAALRVVTDREWMDARREFDEIGYCCFTPGHLIKGAAEAAEKPRAEERPMVEGVLEFETGSLSKEEVEAILNTLPVDITFVDKDDSVKYFNKAERRVFVRTKAVIGRKVQLCHPQKSIHVVNKILDAFKRGERDVAEFWIQKEGRLIHIRYFAVRDGGGKYLGTMEVTQDITDLKKIENEKRLLDWEG